MTTTSESSSQQSINLRPKDELVQEILLKAITNAPIHVEGVNRIPVASLLDELRRVTGREDEADTCMEFIRSKIGKDRCAEIGRVGDDDANYIIIYPRDKRPADFRKSKTNVLTVAELVKVAIFSLENEVKPYQTICGVKVTRSNLTTVREIASIIKDALPNVKIMSFANKYTSTQINQIISQLNAIKMNIERNEAIQVLKERGFTEAQITRLFPS